MDRMKLLALDFDGVISDSAPESFVVALRTYCALRPGSELEASREVLQGAPAEIVREDPLYRAFVALMPLGNRAEDYGVVLSALEAGLELRDQRDYDAAAAAEPAGFLGEFHERFYQVRAGFRSDDPVRWVELLGPYPELLEILRRRRGEVELAIATAKDRESVVALLREYAVQELFSEECVVDKEAGRMKTSHLGRLHEHLGVAYPDITFVDDKVNHLEAVAPLGVRCVLAGWGYNGPREHDRARELGYLVCTLADFEARLFDT